MFLLCCMCLAYWNRHRSQLEILRARLLCSWETHPSSASPGSSKKTRFLSSMKSHEVQWRVHILSSWPFISDARVCDQIDKGKQNCHAVNGEMNLLSHSNFHKPRGSEWSFCTTDLLIRFKCCTGEVEKLFLQWSYDWHGLHEKNQAWKWVRLGPQSSLLSESFPLSNCSRVCFNWISGFC